MSLIEIHTLINADAAICFDLARNINVHEQSLKHSDEKAIAGKTSGLISLGEWVSWEGKHLGFVQHLTSRITEFNAPHYFVDQMVYGAFKSFKHTHVFKKEGNQTRMIDEFDFKSPYGILGQLVNVLFLKRYMVKLLKTRAAFIKQKAEAI